MALYHINDAGNAGRCAAQRRCPFGGDKEHFDTAEEARAAYERTMKKKLPEEWESVQRVRAQNEKIEAKWQALIDSGGPPHKTRKDRRSQAWLDRVQLEHDLYASRDALRDAKAEAEEVRQSEGIPVGRAPRSMRKKFAALARKEWDREDEWARRNAWEKQFESKYKSTHGINAATGHYDNPNSHTPF